MNRSMYHFSIGIALLLLPIVSLAQKQSGVGFWVKHVGAMHKVMRDRDFSAHIDLATLKGTPHLYALGPSEGLNAEITVFDGQPAIAVVERDAVQVKRTFPKAAFLVYAQVNRWRQVTVPATVRTAKELEAFVAKAATSNGLSTDKPFPFLVRGIPAQLSYHVVKAGEHISFEVNGKPLEVLGFYSAHHHGVFTHQGTNIHLHFRARDNKASGHIDALVLRPGARLYLPDLSPMGKG